MDYYKNPLNMNNLKRQNTCTQTTNNKIDDLVIKEYTHNKEIYWSLKFKNSKQTIKCQKPLTKEIANKIINITPMILSDSKFEGSEISFIDNKFKLTTKTGKEVFITDDSGNIIQPAKIIKKLSYQDMKVSDICPITLESINDFIKNGVEIYKIKGENNPYKLDDLEFLLQTNSYSPITRKFFTRNDIVKWVNEDNTDLPIGILNPTKKRKTLFKNESSTNKIKKLDDNDISNPINIVCLVDKSYSMGSYNDNVATKPLLDYLNSLHQDSTVSILGFSNDVNEIIKKVKKSDIDENYLKRNLIPDGSTYFNGAIVKVIEDWDNLYDNNMKNLLLVITDGEDNMSSTDEIIKMNDMVKYCWENIPCYFMHPPNIDGSKLLNIDKGQCLAFDNDKSHTSIAVNGLSQITRDYSASNDNNIPVISNDLRRQSSQYTSCYDDYEEYDQENNIDLKTIRHTSAPN